MLTPEDGTTLISIHEGGALPSLSTGVVERGMLAPLFRRGMGLLVPSVGISGAASIEEMDVGDVE